MWISTGALERRQASDWHMLQPGNRTCVLDPTCCQPFLHTPALERVP